MTTKWNEDLKSPHLDIAASNAKKIGVLAGPGTGKTAYGLIRRVTRLLETGVSGKKILLLSFTRTAAIDLKSKVASIGISGIDEVWATTLHSYCFSLLQRDSVLRITGRTARTLLNHETDLMLRDLRGDFGTIIERRKKLKEYEAGWAKNIDDYPGLATLPEDMNFETQVLRWLRHHKAMLIGEVVPLAYKYLANNPTASELGSFEHVIVDEYQDLNTVEQKLIGLLSDSSNICIAGDDDQSIYSFRCAHPQGIIDFCNRKDVETHQINTSGRSPQQILDLANSLISHSPNRGKPKLECLKPKPGIVDIIQWNHLSAEINGIVAAIANDIQKEKWQPGDILVLSPSRYIGENIRDGLRELDVEAYSYFTEDSLNSDRSKEVIEILNLLVNPKDMIAWRSLLGAGDADGRSRQYTQLVDYSTSIGKTELEVLDSIAKGSKELTIASLLNRYVAIIRQLESLKGLNVEEVIDKLMPEEDGDTKELRELAKKSAEGNDDMEKVLGTIITVITQPEVPQNPTTVRIMSLHKSKGLTSPCVYVVGVVNGLIPNLKDVGNEVEQEAAYQEQRRLFYVAITRSSNQLVVSSSASMGKEAYQMGLGSHVLSNNWGRGILTVRTISSPFLVELGSTQPKSIKGEEWFSNYTKGSNTK